MKKLLFLLPLLPSLLLADVSAEKLAEIRQQALEQAVIFHKGKNPSTSQLLQTAREFEDYLLNQSPVSSQAFIVIDEAEAIPSQEQSRTYQAKGITRKSFAKIKPYIEGQLNYFDIKDTVQTDAKSYTVGSYTGALAFGFNYDEDTTAGIEFGVGGLAENLRVGFSYTKPTFDLSTLTLTDDGSGIIVSNSIAVDAGFSPSADAKIYMLKAYYDFDVSDKFKPFVGVGIGQADISDTDDKELAYSASAGAKYYLSDNIYLGGSFSYIQVDGPKETVEGITFKYSDLDIYNFSALMGFEF